MTPKEKARELFDKTTSIIFDADSRHLNMDVERKCAIAIVDEILKENQMLDNYQFDLTKKLVERYEFWNQVKQELEKM